VLHSVPVFAPQWARQITERARMKGLDRLRDGAPHCCSATSRPQAALIDLALMGRPHHEYDTVAAKVDALRAGVDMERLWDARQAAWSTCLAHPRLRSDATRK